MANETPKSRIRVLHLEDNEHDRIFVAEMLRTGGLDCHIVAVKAAGDFEWELRNRSYDLIISDYSIPSFNGLSGLMMAREISPHIPFIFFSGTIGEESAIESLKQGAVDYVLKQRPHRLVPAIRQALHNVAAGIRLKDTEQKNREQAELLDKATDAILVCDLNRRIIYWNRGAERIYGWAAHEVEGKDLVQVLFHGAEPSQGEEIRKGIGESGEWNGEIPELTKDGRAILIQCRITLIRDASGQPKSLLAINTDITERKHLEEQLLRAHRLESLGTLVSGIAHDLNNTLGPVLIGIDVLRKAPAEQERILQMMEKSARRGAEMIKQMLAFARGGATCKVVFSIESLVNEMSKTLTHTFPKSIQCEIKVGEKLWLISGVSTQLYQVLMNLCVNARDAMPEGGKLTLSVENISLDAATAASIPDAKAGNYVCICVADTGKGMSPEQMKKVFQPFYSTKAPGKGTGLGLSTSLYIVKNHGGFLTVASQINKGTEFKCHLPAVIEAPLPEPAPPPMPRGNGECVLLVEDEAVDTRAARTTLESHGYRVLAAENGLEAVTSLSENRSAVDLVITEMELPLMGGSATAVALRRIRPDLKVVMVGESEKPAEELKRKIHINGFISKPVTAEKLLRTVHAVMACH